MGAENGEVAVNTSVLVLRAIRSPHNSLLRRRGRTVWRTVGRRFSIALLLRRRVSYCIIWRYFIFSVCGRRLSGPAHYYFSCPSNQCLKTLHEVIQFVSLVSFSTWRKLSRPCERRLLETLGQWSHSVGHSWVANGSVQENCRLGSNSYRCLEWKRAPILIHALFFRRKVKSMPYCFSLFSFWNAIAAIFLAGLRFGSSKTMREYCCTCV